MVTMVTMVQVTQSTIPQAIPFNHSSLSATMVTTLWLNEPICFCSVEIMHRSIQFRDHTLTNEIAENTGTMF